MEAFVQNTNKTKKLKPLVSIIVPSYNHDKYITQCIESIVNQSFSNFELIVVDDGSTDNSRKILSKLKLQHGFKLIFQENKGLSSTLTDVIKNLSSGQYIAMCASDDYWSYNKIEEQVKFLEDHKDHPMCFSKCHYIDKESVKLTSQFHYLTEEKFRTGYLFEDIFLMNYHLPVSYMFTRKILEELNFFPEYIYCEDFYMNLKISENYPIGYIDKYLVYYRFEINSAKKNIAIINSQKEILDSYNTHNLYQTALKKWKIRVLNTYSNYPQLKLKLIPYLFDIEVVNSKSYWKSLVKLIIKW